MGVQGASRKEVSVKNIIIVCLVLSTLVFGFYIHYLEKSQKPCPQAANAQAMGK